MRPTRALTLTLAAGLALPVAGHAAEYVSRMPGDWSSPTIWAGGKTMPPGPDDDVTISAGHVVTLPGPASVASVTVLPDAELKLDGYDLTVARTLNMSGTGLGNATISSAWGAPTVTVNGTLDLGHAAITGAYVTVTPGAAGGIRLGGYAAIARTLTINGPGTVTFGPQAVHSADPARNAANTPMLSVGTLVRCAGRGPPGRRPAHRDRSHCRA